MIGYDMSGRAVDLSRDDLAAGYYLYSDEAIQQMAENGQTPCGTVNQYGEVEGLRPGKMVVGRDDNGNSIYVDTCAGELIQNHLPDVVIHDEPWKPYVKYVNAAAVFVLVLILFRKL